MLNNVFIKYVAIIIMLVVLSGCAGNSIPTQPAPSEPNQDVQVNETSDEVVTFDETIHINNCGGKADSKQVAQRSFSTKIEGAAQLKVGYEIVESSITAKYGQLRNISKSHEISAPAGTNMEFILRWKEQTLVGSIIANGSSGTYNVHVPISVEQISSLDLGCGYTTTPTIDTPIPPTSTYLPEINSPIGMVDETYSVSAYDTALGSSFNTGVYIQSGDRVKIKYSSGEWWIGQGSSCNGYGDPQTATDATGYVGRDGERVESLIGCDNPNICRPLTSAPWGSLLGTIGEKGSLFHIGNELEFVSETNGILYLRINYFNHNAVTGCPYGDGGSISVSVNVTPP
jgi:hypothetical protein